MVEQSSRAQTRGSGRTGPPRDERMAVAIEGGYESQISNLISHWILWITSRHTLERKHAYRQRKNSGTDNHKNRSTRKIKRQGASTNKSGIPINQPLRRSRGHRRQPCLVAGGRNRGRVRCNRRSPFAWRWPWFSGGWRYDHCERRGKGRWMTRGRYRRHG